MNFFKLNETIFLVSMMLRLMHLTQIHIYLGLFFLFKVSTPDSKAFLQKLRIFFSNQSEYEDIAPPTHPSELLQSMFVIQTYLINTQMVFKLCLLLL